MYVTHRTIWCVQIKLIKKNCKENTELQQRKYKTDTEREWWEICTFSMWSAVVPIRVLHTLQWMKSSSRTWTFSTVKSLSIVSTFSIFSSTRRPATEPNLLQQSSKWKRKIKDTLLKIEFTNGKTLASNQCN